MEETTHQHAAPFTVFIPAVCHFAKIHTSGPKLYALLCLCGSRRAERLIRWRLRSLRVGKMSRIPRNPASRRTSSLPNSHSPIVNSHSPLMSLFSQLIPSRHHSSTRSHETRELWGIYLFSLRPHLTLRCRENFRICYATTKDRVGTSIRFCY